MEKHSKKILDLIEERTGTRNVSSLKYKEVTEDMTKSSFDTSLTRGNVNLISGRIKTMKDVVLNNENFIHTQIP